MILFRSVTNALQSAKTRSALIAVAQEIQNMPEHFARLHRGWSFKLLEWAGQCRRRAMAAAPAAPAQRDLFGGAA